MNILKGKETFEKLFPEIMKSTRMLLIDHDVTRYHSYDLVRYEMFRHSDLLLSLKPEYEMLRKPQVDIMTRVHFMQTQVEQFNIFDMFNVDAGVHTMPDYEARVRAMLADPVASSTPTDIGRRFDIVFDRPGITGYLLQYKGEKNRPTSYNKMTVYESDTLLDLDMAIAIIKKHKINAIIVGSASTAVLIGARLTSEGITYPITCIIGQYRYNYNSVNKLEPCYPNFIKEMGSLELKYRYEFGYFDPFSGITAQFRLNEMLTEGVTSEDE